MMYITVNAFGDNVTVGWHVGQKNPIVFDDMQHVTEVQADGDELEYIRFSMNNVPFNKFKAVNRWFGSMAQFIAANL